MPNIINEQHYRPAAFTDELAISNIDKAYEIAGVTVPNRASAAADLLYAEPNADTVQARVAAEAITTEDPEAWLTDAIDAMVRAMAVDRIRAAYPAAAAAATAAELPRITATAAADLAPAFKRTVKALAKAAAKLPRTEDPFDLAAIVDADATAEMKQAADCLEKLAVFASIVRSGSGVDNVPVWAVLILPVLDVPNVTPARKDITIGLAGTIIRDEHSQHRTAMQRLARDADRHGMDRALIGVARDEYAGVTFKLAASPEEAIERRERMRRAHTVHRVDPARERAAAAWHPVGRVGQSV